MSSIRSKLVTAAAVGAAAVGGAAVASAATSGTTNGSPSASSGGPPAGQARPPHDPHQGGHTFNGKTEKLLSGDVESKVRAAALAKVPGTVERVETNVDSSAPYEAHIVRKSDGAEVEVQVNSDYSVAAVNAMNGRP